MNNMQEKKALRKKMIELRESMSSDRVYGLSAKIAHNLLQLDEIKNANSFFIYASKGNEVYTHDLIKTFLNRGKMVSLPKILNEEIMMACRLENWSDLMLGKYNIICPTKNYFLEELEVSIVPCLALTKKGERLGRGKGYYDRFLQKHPEVLAIALAYDYQIVPYISVEKEDKRMDLIITESRIIRCK